MHKSEHRICVECLSPYHEGSSRMLELCPECSHHIYGYPNCEHRFENGHCVVCGWNGAVSEYVASLRS